jgi:hypothetical protein
MHKRFFTIWMPERGKAEFMNHNCELGKFNYYQVGAIMAESLGDAFTMSQNDFNPHYSIFNNRSCSVGDVICDMVANQGKGQFYMVEGSGWTKVAAADMEIQKEEPVCYIAYMNPWTEGSVVVRTDDTKFAIGYGHIGVQYEKSLNYVLSMSEIIVKTNDIEEAVKHDSALYTRYPKDNKEYELYQAALNLRLIMDRKGLHELLGTPITTEHTVVECPNCGHPYSPDEVPPFCYECGHSPMR